MVVLSDGVSNHDRQSLAVAAALGLPCPPIVQLAALPFRSSLPLPVPLRYERAALAAVPPSDILLTTGRPLSRVSRWLKAQAGAARPLFTVQIAGLAGRPADFDVVALPWHKASTRCWIGASNVTLTAGAPVPALPDQVAAEAERWRERLYQLPTPRLAVLVGGDSRGGPLRRKIAHRLIDNLLVWAKRSRGSLLVTTSWRTGPQISDLFASELRRQLLVPYYLWRPDGGVQIDNLHLGYLTEADAVVATDDSVTQVGQVIAVGRPVYLFGDDSRVAPAAAAFFAMMEQDGRLARWNGVLDLVPPSEALTDAALIARFVRARWQAANEPHARQLIPHRRVPL